MKRTIERVKELFAAAVITLLFACCGTIHKSELKQETGIVIAKQFRGEVNETGTGMGITTGGDMTMTTISIHESEKFDVVFKCEHGVVFIIDNVNIYTKMNEGDTVLIDYYELLDEDNILKDLDFVDANVINH